MYQNLLPLWRTNEELMITAWEGLGFTNNYNLRRNSYVKGSRHYELSNHTSTLLSAGLGNVLAVVSDRKIEVDERYAFAQGGGYKYENGAYHLDAAGSFAQLSAADGIISSYVAEVISATDYYAFGAPMPGRTYQANEYRFGFNGQEKDDETYGDGNIYDYGFRVYDPRKAKFLSVDPLTKSYPWYTPYQFAGNKPIWAIDLDGLEEWYSTVNLCDYKAVLKPTSFGPLSIEYSKVLGLNSIPSVIFPEFSVKPPTLIDDVILYTNEHEFIFEFEGNISFGPQIGLEAELNGRNIGIDVNIGSVELIGAKSTIVNMDGKVEGNYIGKESKGTVKQGLSGGLGIFSAEVEREFVGSLSGDGAVYRDDLKLKAGVGAGPVGVNIEKTYLLVQTKNLQHQKTLFLVK